MDKYADNLYKTVGDTVKSEDVDSFLTNRRKEDFIKEVEEIAGDYFKSIGLNDIKIGNIDLRNGRGKIEVYSDKYKEKIPYTLFLTKDGFIDRIGIKTEGLENAYGVNNWEIDIPSIGKYEAKAINKKSAIRSVFSNIFKARKEIVLNGIPYTEKDVDYLSEQIISDNVRKADEKMEQKRATPELPNIVVEKEQYIPDTTHITGEEGKVKREFPVNVNIPLGDIEKEIEKKKEQSIINQSMIKAEQYLEERGIPAEIEDVKITKRRDNKIEGSINIAGDITGNFLFKAAVNKDCIIEDFHPSFNIVKGYYGTRLYEVDLGEAGRYQIEHTDIKTATKKVLESVKKKFGGISYSGVLVQDIPSVAEKLIQDKQVYAIGTFPYPDNTVLENKDNPDYDLNVWEVTENEDGEKMLIRKSTANFQK